MASRQQTWAVRKETISVIFFHSDLSRESGETNGQKLENINWGNYDLVVIDESHNFRNGGKISGGDDDTDPKENRYLKLMNKTMSRIMILC